MVKLLGTCGVVFAVAVIAVVATVVVLWLRAGDSVDCEKVTITPERWKQADYQGRREIEDEIKRCEILKGKTPAEVRELLGADDGFDGTTMIYNLPRGTAGGGSADDQMQVMFRDGRVFNTTLNPAFTPQ